ncbi:transporter substrate-binding domain-containing protein [Marinomonas posidonica]|uniref:transporter substrate-binding domain-containing protein n=1 Tax=Marinomonas posidonica TaxID=936476 RepID=UPI00373563B7
MSLIRFILAMGLFILATATVAHAECLDVAKTDNTKPLIVAVKFSPPFLYESNATVIDNAGWSGITADLWREIADCLQLSYRFTEFVDDQDIVSALSQQEVDVVLGPFVPNADVEGVADFSHSYFKGHIGVLVAEESGWASLVRLLQNFPFMETLFVLLVLLSMMVCTALLYWQAEHKSLNPLFTDGPLRGFYNAMIWATLLVFSGQGSPFEVKHRVGQVLVIILMFFGVSFVSIVTALLTSALTLQGLGAQISNVKDLDGKKIAYLNALDSDLKGQSVVDFLQEHGLQDSQQLFSWSQVMLGLQEKRLDAFIHSKEEMQFLISSGYLKGVTVLPLDLEQKNYSIIMTRNSSLTKPINRQILTTVNSKAWQIYYEQYLN